MRNFLLLKVLWLGAESNRRHEDFQSTALPTELPSRIRLLSSTYGTSFHLKISVFPKLYPDSRRSIFPHFEDTI
jgi:hypothetical protein